MAKEEYSQRMLDAFDGDGEAPDIILSYGGICIEAVWVEDLTDTSINQTVYNGKIVGLPHWEASVSGTLYNKEIFEKYHLSISKTQEEFMDVCQILLQELGSKSRIWINCSTALIRLI